MAGLVDHRGRPIRRRDLLEERTAGTVGGVRSVQTTHPASGITPQRLAALLRTAEHPGGADRYLELAEEMEERDPHYLGVLQTRKRQVAQIGVAVDPASDDPEHVEDAELVKAFLAREELEDELFDVLDSVGKGFSVAEIIWETSERQWMPVRMEHRLPQWFDFDRRTGSILSRRPDGPEDYQRLSRDGDAWVELEPWKYVAHRSQAKSGLPIRGGIARSIAWFWLFKNIALKDWVRFAEAYGMPLRLGRYHEAATQRDRDVLLRAVTSIAADAAAVIPQGMDVEFVDDATVRGRSEIYRDLTAYIDAQISIVVLGQTLTTQEGDSGRYALGQVHDRVRGDIERSDGRQLAATLRRDLVVPMVALNRGPPKDGKYPTVRIEREEAADLKLLADSLDKLVALGLDVKKDQIRTRFKLEKPEDGDEILEARAVRANDAVEDSEPPASDDPESRDDEGDVATAGVRRLLTALAAADGNDDAVDMAVARAMDGWQPIVEPVVEPVLAAAGEVLAAGGTLADFRSRLPGLLDDMDDAALGRLLHHLTFSAALSGREIPDDGGA